MKALYTKLCQIIARKEMIAYGVVLRFNFVFGEWQDSKICIFFVDGIFVLITSRNLAEIFSTVTMLLQHVYYNCQSNGISCRLLILSAITLFLHAQDGLNYKRNLFS